MEFWSWLDEYLKINSNEGIFFILPLEIDSLLISPSSKMIVIFRTIL
jgi:hypothetical protein